jgi:anti-sigma factor RsiW
MTCWYWHRLLSDYLDEGLTAPRRRRLEAHLEACPQGRELLAELSELREAARGLENYPLPEGGWQRLQTRLAAQDIAAPAALHSRLRSAALAVACATFLLIALQTAQRTPLQRHLLAELRAAEKAAAPQWRAELAAAYPGPHDTELRRGRLEVDRALRSARRALLAHPNDPAAKRSYVRALHQHALLSELRLI